MKTLLFLLLLPLVTTAQEPAARPDGPPLEVLDADVKVHPPPRSVKGPPGSGAPPAPMSTGDIPGRSSSTSRQSNTATNPSRAAELNREEERRERSTMSRRRGVTVPRTSPWYEYRLRVRNVGSKRVKSLLWEYRVVDAPAASAAATRRLFQCAEELKPGQSKRLRAWTPSAPVTVVSADAAGGTPKAEAVINRVEYADGTVWQREGWEPGEAKTVNPEEAERNKRKSGGECLAL